MAVSIKWKGPDPFFEAAPVAVPLFGKKLRLSALPEDEDSTGVSSAQAAALEQILKVPASKRDRLTHPLALDCQYVCLRFEIDGDDPPVKLKRREDVWKKLRLGGIFIPRQGKSKDRYVFVHGECDWEQEHGLELLFKNGELLKVGRQDGLAQNEEWDLYYINE